jgi:WD40 repeat protein
MDRFAQSLVGPEGASTRSYDLFIVHAAADRAWVEGYLKVELGLDPGRVITPREFNPTATVPAEFASAVTSSRFTMLVLSPAFLADEWARFGGELVSFASVEAGQNQLLAVDREVCKLPLNLRFLVRLNFTDPDRAGWEEEMARLRAVLDRPAPVVEAVECPYPGMVPFRKQDARFFHGRDEEIQNLLTLVRQHHFLFVIGPSGSGKSSLVMAGLLPRLDDPKHFPRGTWRVLTMRPGATPLDELARVVVGVSDDSAAAVTTSLDAEPPARRLLLVVDQFEELFSQVKDGATREQFIGRLKSLRADPRCLLILTMRADFYGDLMNSPLWPVDRSQIVEIAPLRGGALRRAIVKPAEAAGVFLEEGLVDRLIADAANEPGSLPLLQEALVLLWGTMLGRLLTRASYDSLGRDGRSGLAVAMATKADATLADLPPEELRISRRIVLRLVQFGEGRPDTRRQLGVDDLRAATDVAGVFDRLLQLMITNRLLTASADESRGLRVDIAHEMLIVGWPASQEWVRVRRDAEEARRRLIAKAKEWVRLGRGDHGLLDLAELAEADGWLRGPDAADLGIDADLLALVSASRDAIAREGQEEEDRRRRELQAANDLAAERGRLAAERGRRIKVLYGSGVALMLLLVGLTGATFWALRAQRQATEQTAELSMGAGSIALTNRQSFHAMHQFAGAIKILPTSSSAQVVMRQGLGFLARETPRLEAILEHSAEITSATFSADGDRVVTASRDHTARIWRCFLGEMIVELKDHTDEVNSAAFSRDGTRVVTASSDKTARIWQAETAAVVAELKGHKDTVNSAAFSEDGSRVVTASNDNTARIWQSDTGTLIAVLKGHVDKVNSAAFSRDGSHVVTASNDNTARIWRGDTGALICELKDHFGVVTSATFNRNGSRIVGASRDRTARIWRSDTGAAIAELKGHADAVFSAAFSGDGTRVVTASNDKTARIWCADTGALIAELRGHTGWVGSAEFGADDSRVLTTSSDNTARIWRGDTGAPIAELKGHTGRITSTNFSADGRSVVTASVDKTARIWQAETRVPISVLKGHTKVVRSAAFSADGSRIVTASIDNTARVWRSDTGALIAALKGQANWDGSAALSRDGSRVVTVWGDNTARVWRSDTGALIAELRGHTGEVESAAFSADGSRVVTASRDHTARIWRSDTGVLIAELIGHTGDVRSARFSVDGTRVVTASRDRTARIWQAEAGTLVAELKGHKDAVYSAAFSADGSRVVTESRDSTARIWWADTGVQIVELWGVESYGRSAAFSPDNGRVVTVSKDQTARVWRSDTGEMIAELRGHADRVTSAAFSNDGSRVVTASWDKTARVWRSDTGALIAELRGHTDAIESAAFSADGTRVVTASADLTARIWTLEPVSGDPSVIPLWVEVLTGTELKGIEVRPLSLKEWNRRKDDLGDKGEYAPPDDLFMRPIGTTPERWPSPGIAGCQ